MCFWWLSLHYTCESGLTRCFCLGPRPCPPLSAQAGPLAPSRPRASSPLSLVWAAWCPLTFPASLGSLLSHPWHPSWSRPFYIWPGPCSSLLVGLLSHPCVSAVCSARCFKLLRTQRPLGSSQPVRFLLSRHCCVFTGFPSLRGIKTIVLSRGRTSCGFTCPCLFLPFWHQCVPAFLCIFVPCFSPLGVMVPVVPLAGVVCVHRSPHSSCLSARLAGSGSQVNALSGVSSILRSIGLKGFYWPKARVLEHGKTFMGCKYLFPVCHLSSDFMFLLPCKKFFQNFM